MRNFVLMMLDMQSGLMENLLHSTVFVLLVWVLALVLSRNRASLRYRLWMLASLKFLLPFSLLVSVGQALRHAFVHSAPDQHPLMNEAMSRSVEPYAVSLHAVSSMVNPNAAKLVSSADIWTVCIALWFMGALVMAILWMRGWLRLRDIVSRGRRWGEVCGLPVLLCDDPIDPGVVGILNPVILLPEMLLSRLDEPELETIYAHELFHARRRDNLTASLHAIVHALFWFHPAVWLIRAKLMDERERACDEMVVESGIDAETYARSILNVCKIQVGASGDLMAGMTGGDLKGRVRRILCNSPSATLNLTRKLLLGVAGVLMTTVPVLFGFLNSQPVQAQSGLDPASGAPQTSEKLAFDVAGVRPSKETEESSNVPLGPGDVYFQSHGLLRAKNFPLITYLVFAYKLTDYQEAAIRGAAPDWVFNERYSIEARTDRPEVTKDQLRSMMRTLLAERFGLAAHYEDKQVRVFALSVIKPGAIGPALRQHPSDSACLGTLKRTDPDGKQTEEPLQSKKGAFPQVCNGILGLPASAQDRYSFGGSNVSMKLIASSFSSWGNLGRPVVDQTGLDGGYDFVLDYTPDPRPSYATADSGGPGFQQALKEQLGLKLQDRRAPVSFLLLDHIERPSAN